MSNEIVKQCNKQGEEERRNGSQRIVEEEANFFLPPELCIDCPPSPPQTNRNTCPGHSNSRNLIQSSAHTTSLSHHPSSTAFFADIPHSIYTIMTGFLFNLLDLRLRLFSPPEFALGMTAFPASSFPPQQTIPMLIIIIPQKPGCLCVNLIIFRAPFGRRILMRYSHPGVRKRGRIPSDVPMLLPATTTCPLSPPHTYYSLCSIFTYARNNSPAARA